MNRVDLMFYCMLTSLYGFPFPMGPIMCLVGRQTLRILIITIYGLLENWNIV